MNPDEVIDLSLKICQSITPSIYKSLNFITQKPPALVVGGLKDVKERLSRLLRRFSVENASLCRQFKLRKPRGRDFLYFSGL